MSLKGLFGKDKKTKNIGSLINFQDKLEDVESVGYIDQFLKNRKRFTTHTNFFTASNFAAYGSLEEYYKAGIDRIVNTYPYDGSLKERLAWFNESNGFDLHLFENEYPRTNGYIKLSDNRPGGDGWGTVTSTSGAYGNPETKEYIYIKGGPNIGNVYNTASYQTSNLEINGRNGNTVEFWLKKSEFVSSKTTREVILDITTTGSYQGESAYGRLTVELDSSNSSASPFLITYQSGSTGFKEARIGTTHLYTSASDDSWHHYAISFKNQDNQVKVGLYIDGELNKSVVTGSAIGSLNTALIGSIGSLVAGKDPQLVTRTASDDFIPGLGYGKLSGSLDEFRYWKKERTAKDIGRFWFTQIGAGSNTDPANSPLGFYYKFNEGEVGVTSVDKNVLDYGGRVSNGIWVGYAGYGRYNNSAMVEASASIAEFKDPIIYQNHPLVSSFRQDAIERGYAYDLENSSGMYHSFPAWIVDEDGEGAEDLKKMTQVVASYFDSLFLQIKDMGELRHLKYEDFDKKPHPFNNIKLQSLGLVTPELFLDASNLNTLVNRDEDKEFRQDTSDVKNFIYNNIHNNLEAIFKSKGSDKAFRNLFRCFGIDNELIKINMYSTDSSYPVESSYENSTVKTKYVNFADSVNKDASVIQSIDGLIGEYRAADARGFMKGTNGLVSDDDGVSIGLTTEAQIFFPKVYPISHPFHFATPLSSSILGCHNVADENDDTDLSWTVEGADYSNFQLYVVKEKRHSRTAKFVLKSRGDIFEAMETDYIIDLYDSNRWNVAVRLASDTPAGSNVTGSGNSYRFELYGAKTVADEIQDSFEVSRTISATNAKNFIKNSRRFYIGAEREDFTGTLQNESDVKVANFRVWSTELSNEEINSHAIDPRSYGVDEPSRMSFPLADIGNTQLSKIDLLAINWNFSSLTGSNSNGDMWINDVSSGSLDDDLTYGKLSQAIRRLHPGKGINFASATTSSVDVEYDQATRLQTFENVKASDMVQVVLNDDLTFTRETKPTDYFFSFEKSMYAAITDEMLNFFAGINEFSNLIGAPVERYRQNYKGLSKLRQIFFSRIENSPDIERYTEYYKWLDSSLSVMIDQLVPASVAASEDIRNVIESHILERSKYFNKFPTMDMKTVDPVGQIRGINELSYDWQHGHSPISGDENDNCLWQKERAQRATDKSVSGEIDSDRETIRRISVTSVSGSTYATRRLSRPYRLTVEDQRHAKGGDNTFGNKKKRLYTGISTAHGLSHIAITGSELATAPCNDIENPSKKKRFHATADIAFTSKDLDINDIAPFTIYSSSVDAASDYKAELYNNLKQGVDITNLHSDEYGDDREVTLQSPFTERWVGGNAHRHQDLSGSLLGNISAKKDGLSRVEAFKLLAQGEKLYVLPPNATGIDASNLPIIDQNIQGAQLLREELAKRPVNVKNIATTTGSVSLGNYNHIYDVVQYTSEDQRKDFLVDNLEQVTSSNSTAIPGVQEFSKFARPVRKSVFKARFASPGGTEVAGDSRGGQSLDRATNQYSVYNSLNYRNLSVRGPLDFLNKIPQTASADNTSLVTNHKINANPRYRRSLDGASYNGEVDLNQDNVFVQHPIPQNDYQYAWITASLVTGREPAEVAGHLHSFTQASIGDATGSLAYERTYEFLTASNREGTNIIDFAGLNTYIVDNIDATTNTISRSAIYNLTGTIHHRQGPYGHPSWKQIRAGDSALGRYFRKNNQYSIPVVGDQVRFTTLGNYSWPNNIDHLQATSDRSVTNSNYRFTDPPVSSNRLPIVFKNAIPVPVDVLDIYREYSDDDLFTAVPFRKSVSFNNKLTKFANDDMTKVLGLEPSRLQEKEALNTDDLKEFDFDRDGATAEYSIEVFPQEKNAYLERTRERTQYSADNFWKAKREERTQTNGVNSQGNTIPNLSVWALDAHDNFSTTALKKTTDKLGTGGSGELFGNYAVFHNNLTHPSASALFARPIPYQATSSLPKLKYIDFRLAFTTHRKAQFESNVVVDADTEIELQTSIVTAGELTFDMTNSDSMSGIGTVKHDEIHPSFTNNAGETYADSSLTGPRRYNDGYSVPASGPDTYFFPDTLIGARTAAGSVTDAPGTGNATNTHYRFIEYTGSLSDRPHLFRFQLRTGFNAGSDDAFGLRTSTKPLYLQIKGDTTTTYTTVAKFLGSDYAGSTDGQFQYVSVLVTSSFGDNTKFRFISPTQDSATDGLWSFAFLTIYEGNHTTSEIFADGEYFASVPTITSSVSTAQTSFRQLPVATRYFSPQLTDKSLLSLAKIDLYRDEKSENYTIGNDIFTSKITSPDIATHDQLIIQNSDTQNVAAVYGKDDRIDNHLYGSQFFRTPEHASRNPFNFENYESFAEQAKLLAKDYGLIPEFRISEHINYYINTVGGNDPFFSCNDTFLKITGSTTPQDSSQDTFYEVYSHSDFVKHFNVVQQEMSNVKGASATKLKLECKAFKKFLPYKGFYPADRMVQLAGELSSSYSTFVTGGHWRNVLAPYYAPGIGFNSIKSGIAVDYPVIEPHEDRLYNQYGVIFQSASLAIDEGGNAIQTTTGRPWISGEGGSGASAALSKNRIEIGGGSQWADILTGSSSPGASDSTVTISFWMYLPKSFPSSGPADLSFYGNLVQRGCIATFGSGEVEEDWAWKKGLHFGYYVSSYNAISASNNFGTDLVPESGTDDDYLIDRGYNLSFVCFGGDGKDFFALETSKDDAIFHQSPASPGWNHILLTCDLDSIGRTSEAGVVYSGFKSYVNGQEHQYLSHLTSSSGFDFGTAGSVDTNTGTIKIDGHRNCFIGGHLGYIKRINDSSPSGLRPNQYQNNEEVRIYPGANLQNNLNQPAGSKEHLMADFLKPSEAMMTEIVVLNDFNEHMPEALSGYPSGKNPPDYDYGWYDNISNQSLRRSTNLQAIPLATDLGNGYGPANPYTTLSASFHQNIVGWYRPGNDGGYDIRKSTNGRHIFNHAQDLFSGKIPNHSSSAGTYDTYQMPKVYNHLTGTLYGFTEWTGSVANDLKFSDKYRQRWNGIADITNPTQYTYIYHYPRTDANGSLGSKAPFKTWYTHLGEDATWFRNTTDYVEKTLVGSNTFLSSSYTICSGSTRIPSFIVGTKHNFTNDTSIPRIGSASYGTYHFTGSGEIANDPVYSQGWRTDYQGNTGIRKINRIPFEAIIDPAVFTPEMKDDGDGETSVAIFYEVEPHPSASLLGAFNRQRKYVGQNSHGQQVFKWTSGLDKQHADDPELLTDENFHLGVAMNSSSVMAQFDLEQARSQKSVYSLAASNFYAETMNLFLANGKGVTIRSADRPAFTVTPGQTYEMSIELNAGYNRRLRRDNPMYNNPAAFGIPFDAGKFRDQHPDGLHFSRSADYVGYGFAPYLPPHYDGYARATYTFTPTEGPAVYDTIADIVRDTSVRYHRRVSATGSIFRKSTGFASNEREDANSVIPSYNRRFAMHISESFNGLSLTSDDAFVQSYDTNGNPIDASSIVIQTKFECPTFDFGSVDANQPRTEKTTQHLPKIKGIWHQTGSYLSDNRPAVNIVKPPAITGKGDLSQLLGLHVDGDKNRVGEMPERVTVYEGVVAIPFKTVNNVKKFFNLPPQEVYQAVRNLNPSYSDYKLKTDEDRRRYQEYANLLDSYENQERRTEGDSPTKIIPRPSVQSMVKSMLRYNIPPQFNFLKYNNPDGKYIKPFAMYIFDFSVDLNRADLARIWQNVTPDIGLDFYGNKNTEKGPISSQVVEHDLFDLDDLLNPTAQIAAGIAGGDGFVVEGWENGLDDEVQWMVFKVKQKAEADYFRKMKLDRLPDGHPEKKRSVEDDVFKYGFNWPYDYFSLVELVNLKATVGFTKKSIEVIDPQTAGTLLSRRDNE